VGLFAGVPLEMQVVLTSKLPDVGTTIFTVMSALAQRHDALNLSQGFPDMSAPHELLDRVAYHMHAGHNQYSPSAGVPELRTAIATKVAGLYGRQVDADDEVTVTSGATEALFCAIAVCVHPGDEVLVLEPAYDCYGPAIKLQGGRVVSVPLEYPDFGVDWQRVADAITPRTRAILVNSPHNPAGAAFSSKDIDALAALCEQHDLWVIADEVYEHIVFDGCMHHSVLRSNRLYPRSFVIFSFGKIYHMTGWKIGYCVAPAALTREFRRIHQFVTFSTMTPAQLGLADFMCMQPDYHLQLGDFYQRKRDILCDLLQDSRFHMKPSAGTYFQLLDYRDITTEPDRRLAERWTREHALATIPMSVFYADPPRDQFLLRVCFAKDDATLEKAAAILNGL